MSGVRAFGVVVTAATLMACALGGCGGSGGDNGRTYPVAQVSARLGHDELAIIMFQQHNLPQADFATVMRCFAVVLEKDVPAEQLAAYMNGDLRLTDFTANTNASAVEGEFATCLDVSTLK